MLIKRVKKTNFYDVFCGDGWKHHTRIMYKNKRVGHISGNILPKIKLVEIAKNLEAV